MDSTVNVRSGLNLLHIAAVIAIVVAIGGLLSGLMVLLGANGAENASTAEGFVGGILAMLAGFLTTLIVGVMGLVGFIVEMVGLNTASKDDQGYKQAFTLVWVCIGLAVLGAIIPGVFGSIISILATAGNLYVIYLIIETTKKLLQAKAENETVEIGNKVWMIEMVSVGASVVGDIIGIITKSSGAFYGIVGILVGVVGVYAAINLNKFYKAAKDRV